MNLISAAKKYLKTTVPPNEMTTELRLEVGRLAYSPIGVYQIAQRQLRCRGTFKTNTEKNQHLNYVSQVPIAITEYLVKNPDAAAPQNRPKYAGCNVDVAHYLLLAITFSCRSSIMRKEIDFLTGGERGFVRTADWLEKVAPADYLNIAKLIEAGYSIEQEARDLAEAFEVEMLAKAAGIKRPPLIGAYRMSPPLFPMLMNFRPGEFRLVVKADHIWWSHIDEAGDCTVAFWSPQTDNLDAVLPPIYSWPVRIFLACLWYDLKHTETKIIKRMAPKNCNEWRNKPKIPTVVLPRKIWDLRWGHENSKVLYEKYGGNGRTEKRRSPRIHYRRLHDGWRASDEARDNAAAWGQPDPPEGWTFVSPNGAPPQDVPRLISTGLDVASIVLSSLDY